MFGFAGIATSNLMASYAARFRIDPDSDGYLFTASDYGGDARCSALQYQDYTEEFGAFLDSRRRFMIGWFVLMLVAFAGGLGWQLLYRGEPLPPLIDRYLPHLGGAFMLLPFPVLVAQGMQLWRRPTRELATALTGLGGRRSRAAVMDQRLRGMSWQLVIGGLLACVAVFAVALGKWQGGYEQAWVGPAAAIGVLGFTWLAWRKRQAHATESRLQRAQQSPDLIRAQQALLELSSMALYAAPPAIVREAILSLDLSARIPDGGTGIERRPAQLWHDWLSGGQQLPGSLFLALDWKCRCSDYHALIEQQLGERAADVSWPDCPPDDAGIAGVGVLNRVQLSLLSAGLSQVIVDDGGDTLYLLLVPDELDERALALCMELGLSETIVDW